MKNIVCLISGRGSNLQAILAAQDERDWATQLDARVAAVVANRADAPGLAFARARGLPAHVVPHGDYGTRAAFEAELAACIDRHAPALVVLAGFLRVLTPDFVARYSGRLVNIHPSLLPAFTGLDTHARALRAGVRVHGSTVHFVTADLDAGPIVAQSALAVGPGEDVAALAARVLALEHALLPRCIEWILRGEVRLDAGRVAAAGLGRGELMTWTP
jgi:phosphoribosylglycinamide formyltransferase 1